MSHVSLFTLSCSTGSLVFEKSANSPSFSGLVLYTEDFLQSLSYRFSKPLKLFLGIHSFRSCLKRFDNIYSQAPSGVCLRCGELFNIILSHSTGAPSSVCRLWSMLIFLVLKCFQTETILELRQGKSSLSGNTPKSQNTAYVFYSPLSLQREK